MRRALFWFGWAVLIALPLIFAFQIWWYQDLPRVEPWKWAIPFVAVIVVYFSRNPDDVLKHHIG